MDDKKFVKPEANKVEFAPEDIILASLGVQDSLDGWDDDGNKDSI